MIRTVTTVFMVIFTVRLKPETSNMFPVTVCYCHAMASWRFLSNHGRALVCIANDPGARLRDVAARLEITDRRAHGIITDLVESGYVTKTKNGRRNQYQIRVDLPIPDPPPTGPKIGEVLELLAWTGNTNTT